MKKFYAGMILAGMLAAALATAGCSNLAGMITTVYSISLDQTGDYAFPGANAEYGVLTPKAITVRNTGNLATGALAIVKSGANPGSFTVSKTSLNNIAPGGNDSFTVVPNTGLAIGAYTAKITVSGGYDISESLNVSFTVTANPGYSISLSETRTHIFPATMTGYGQQTAETITVDNTGEQATGALSIVKSGANADSFTVSTTSLNSITTGGSDSFMVVPNLGLGAGTYTATITVSGENSISASFAVSFTVNSQNMPSYSIGLNQSGTYTFPDAAYGYGAQNPRTVTVNNTGNQATGTLSIGVSGANASSFTMSTTSLGSIAVGGNNNFTVAPNTGLGAGTYTATITVSGGNGISANFNVSFTVAAALAYSIGLSPGGTYAFPGAAPGYGAQSARTVTVSNTGNQATGALSIGVSGTNANSFAVSTTSLNSIAVGGNNSFTVAPSTGLAVGIYTATITVSGGNDISESFNVSFTISSSLSSNANLGNLSVSPGTLDPVFSANITVYTVLVPNSTSSFTVTATVADTGKATLSPSSPHTVTLSAVSTPITLTVAAEDGTTRNYTVTVNKTAATNSIDVTVGIADERIDLTRNTENDLSGELGDILRLMAPEGYTNYTWFVDMGSSSYNTISEKIIEIPAYWYNYGTHSVLLKYEKDGIPYGCEVLFRVVR